MKIQVLGTGCPSCHQLFELTKKAVEEMELKTEVEYINDIRKILELGVMSVPVLVVDGKAIISGVVPSIGRIKEALRANIADEQKDASIPRQGDQISRDMDHKPMKDSACGCSCSGDC